MILPIKLYEVTNCNKEDTGLTSPRWWIMKKVACLVVLGVVATP